MCIINNIAHEYNYFPLIFVLHFPAVYSSVPVVYIVLVHHYGTLHVDHYSALIANLYTRYCDREENECQEDVEAKFIIFPVFGFIIMAIWVSSI